MSMKGTNVTTFMASLNQGKLQKQLGHILSDVAGAVIDHGRQGNVNIKLKIKQLGEGSQVTVEHTLDYKRPTSKGSRSEDNVTVTPMHVGSHGDLSLMPENQTEMFDGEENVTPMGKGAAHG